jgi:hypothetical protein
MGVAFICRNTLRLAIEISFGGMDEMSAFKVSRDAEGLYVVEDRESKRWWTASQQSDGWHIMTGDKLRVVQEDGRLGKRIISAIANFKKMLLVRATLAQ